MARVGGAPRIPASAAHAPATRRPRPAKHRSTTTHARVVPGARVLAGAAAVDFIVTLGIAAALLGRMRPWIDATYTLSTP